MATMRLSVCRLRHHSSRLLSICVTLLCIIAAVQAEEDSSPRTCDATTAADGSCETVEDSIPCVDEYDAIECPKFALRGECLANPVWMHPNCRKSCGLCTATPLPSSSSSSEPCQDLNSKCPHWTSQMECWSNPGYMMHACPKSCWQCFDDTTTEDRIRLYSQTHFGEWQYPKAMSSVETMDDIDMTTAEFETAVQTGIQDMERYARELPLDLLGPKAICNNDRIDCMQSIILSGNSCENVPTLSQFHELMDHCSLACQACDKIELYRECTRPSKTDAQRLREKLVNTKHISNLYEYLQTTHNAQNIVNWQQSDDTSNNNNDRDEWVLSLQTRSLFATEEDFEEVANVIKTAEWTNATRNQSSGGQAAHRDGEVYHCRPSNGCFGKFPMLQRLRVKLKKMLNLRAVDMIPSLEFVRYSQRGQRYSSHLDYSIHDEWRHGGPKVLTVFVQLQAPTKGGAVGFPDLDWTVVSATDHPIIIWPNVALATEDGELRRLGKMSSEQLPIVEGEMVGFYAWVYLNAHDNKNKCA